MFSDELEGASVSCCLACRTSRAEFDFSCRFSGMLYTPEGKVITERVWNETMDELDFVGVRHILDSMRAK